MIQQLYGLEDLPMKDLEKIGLAENGELKIDQDNLIALLSGRRTDMLRLQHVSHIGDLDRVACFLRLDL